MGSMSNGNSSFAPMTDHLNAREGAPSASEIPIDAILDKQASLMNQGSGIKAYTHGMPSPQPPPLEYILDSEEGPADWTLLCKGEAGRCIQLHWGTPLN